jgi:hypothetical protein
LIYAYILVAIVAITIITAININSPLSTKA